MIKIDLRNGCDLPSYAARLVWEKLFREVGAEKFRSLHDFLCDLSTFERCIADGVRELWWSYDASGMTDTKIFDIQDANTFHICFSPDEITIERVR